jgi:hypothetical protein
MIRNETFSNGICVEADIYNLDSRWYQREEAGVIVAERAMTDAEVIQYGPKPLDATGALATLLAVESALSVQDAANAVGLTEQDLINEAEAWSVGS